MKKIIFGLAMFVYAAAFAGDQLVISEKPEAYATMQCVGVLWNVSGDDNGNAACSVEYRENGALEWKKAMDLFRCPEVKPTQDSLAEVNTWDKNKRGYILERWKKNYLAGSIFDLKEGKEYEIKLFLKDSDGGEAAETLLVKTRIYPKFSDSKSVSVTQVKPTSRDALKKAVSEAKAGATILVYAGKYDGNIKIKVPLTLMAAGDGEVIVEGENKKGSEDVERGIDFLVPDIMLYGITVSRFPYALHTVKGADRIAIIRCTVKESHYGIVLKSSDCYISDCVLTGDNDTALGSFDGEGIQTYGGNGHVICYNRITRFADQMSVETPNSDVFGNDCFDGSDDGMETDGGGPNIRIFKNRFYSIMHHGISFQPYSGGPAYIIRNQIAGMNENVFKDVYLSSGAVLLHNTLVNITRTAIIRNTYSRNNLFQSSGVLKYYEKDELNLRLNMDYDGFISKIKMTAPKMYEDIEQEVNGIAAKEENGFENRTEIPAPPKLFNPAPVFKLKEGSPFVDAGVKIANINDDFTGKAPDLGALEQGAPEPIYGPRSLKNIIIQ